MSNESPGGPPQSGAEDGFPTQPIPQQDPGRPHQGPPQQGQSQGYPQQGQSQGYPQQGQPQQGQSPQYNQQGQSQGYPQQGQSQQYNQQGQSQGYPQQGQPQQYQQQGHPQQYQQQGWDQQQYAQQGWDQQQQQAYAGAPGGPPNKSKTPMIIGIIALIVALILGGIVWFVLAQRSNNATPTPTASATVAPTEEASEEPTVDPTEEVSEEPTVDPTTPEPEPSPTADGDPTTQSTEPTPTDPAPPAGSVPKMPSQVGDFKSIIDPEPELGMYLNATNDQSMVVLFVEGIDAGLMTTTIKDPQVVGIWTCGPEATAEAILCAGNHFGGAVVISASTADVPLADVATFGDALLAAWK